MISKCQELQEVFRPDDGLILQPKHAAHLTNKCGCDDCIVYELFCVRKWTVQLKTVKWACKGVNWDSVISEGAAGGRAVRETDFMCTR